MRLLAGLVVTLCSLHGVEPSTHGDEPQPAATANETLRVLTLNMAHGRGTEGQPLGLPRETVERNIDRITDLLRAESPHIVALQEADGPSAWSGSFDHVARLAERIPMPHVHHGLHRDLNLFGNGVKFGTAILADRPLRDATSVAFTRNDVNARGFVRAVIDFDGRPLAIYSVHLHSESAEIRCAQVDELVESIRAARLPVVVLGDLNSQWSHARDGVRRLAAAVSLEAYRADDNGASTFPSDAPRKRIDWILISPELEFVSGTVIPTRVSDHLAVEAELRWRR